MESFRFLSMIPHMISVEFKLLLRKGNIPFALAVALGGRAKEDFFEVEHQGLFAWYAWGEVKFAHYFWGSSGGCRLAGRNM